MATATTPQPGGGKSPAGPSSTPSIAHDLAAIADRLRQVTVQVRTRGAGVGSGIVWRPDGLIVTNAHVARGARAAVELSDGRTFDAVVTARDPRRDLATLAIPASDLRAATVGDPRTLRPGELVLAVGNPLGVVGAVAVGVVHAVEPRAGDRGPRLIRADVRLAPGNSGGPLADAHGRVIGVNTMIVGGLGCAVPATTVERFVSQVASGAAGPTRASLGVVAQPVLATVGRARALGLMLVEVAAGSAAESAGLLVGDLLLAVDGRPFASPADLRAMVADAGDRVRIDLVRGGRAVTCEVPLRAAAGARAA
jgi:serine protease Do